MSAYEQAVALLAALEDKTEQWERLELVREALVGGERWQRVATYLADCHAASGEFDGMKKSVPRQRALRLASICDTAAKMLRGEYVEGRYGRDANAVLERLDDVSKGIRDGLEARELVAELPTIPVDKQP
jgi:hypothetical protein